MCRPCNLCVMMLPCRLQVQLQQREAVVVKSSRDFDKWRAKSVQLRDQLRLGATARPWTSRAKLRGLPDVERMRDVLDVCFAHMRQKHPNVPVAELIKSLWANPGQAVQRKPIRKKPDTLASNTILYSYEKDCVLSGDSHLVLLGWPKHSAPLTHVTEAECRDMSANGFSVPIACQLMKAFYLCPFAPWWTEES